MSSHSDELTELVAGLSPEARVRLLAELRGPAHERILADRLDGAADAYRQDRADPELRAAYEQATAELRAHRELSRPSARPLVGGEAVSGEES